MSTLARFRKSGGLMQLLQLIETSDLEKQRHLLDLVGKEDPGWASLIKQKCLSSKRILTWPDGVVSQIMDRLPIDFIINLSFVVDGEEFAKIERCLPRHHQLDFHRMREDRKPNQQERWLAQVKLVQLARDLSNSGALQFSTFDPILELDMRLAS